MAFTKITQQDLVNKGVVGLPDTPNLSTTEMQQKFDEIATDVIVPKFNNLVDELDSSDISKRIHSNDVTDLRLNLDNNIEVSIDGGTTYKQTASSGHIIMDGTGRSFPQRSRMQYSANVVISDNATDNTTFLEVPSGVKGDKGDSATIKVGTVTSGNTATVTNVGSQYDAIFDFELPKGSDGQSATIQVGTVTSGQSASVSNRGTTNNAIFDFVLPKGDKGDNGTSFQVLGTYPTYADLIAVHPTGNRGDAYAVGDSTSNVVYNWNNDTQTWDNLGALKGVKGDPGTSASIAIGTVSTSATPTVENVGTSTNAILNFGLQKGDKGDTGTSATIAVGNVTKGENPIVINSGTTTNAVFDFVLPKGDKGDKGDPSTVNGKSGSSVVLYGYDMFLKNYTKPSQYTEIDNNDSIQSAIGKLEARNSGGSRIVVSTDSESLGHTFTLSNGTKTYSQVADSSLKMEFFVDDIGAWTLTNVEASRSTTITLECFTAVYVTLGVGDIIFNVTYTSDYVGATFSVTDGTTTKTKVADTSLSLTLIVADLGTWTISNTLNTRTKTFVVTENGTYNATFDLAPMYSFQAWLDSANITQTFSSLAEVLGDEKTLRTLMTKHASVDYLAEWCLNDSATATQILGTDLVAKWINLRDYALDKLYASVPTIMDTADKYFYGEWVKNSDNTWSAKGNVPIMTSNSAPYGVASGSNIYSSDYDFYKAFDGRTDTGWSEKTNVTNGYIQYKFTNPIMLKRFKFYRYVNASGNIYQKYITVKASNDGTNFDTVLYDGTETETSTQFVSHNVNNNNYWLYIRVYVHGDNGESAINYLQFYGRELSVSVPTMTSNNAPFGEVTESGHLFDRISFDAYKLFDGIDDTSSATDRNCWVSPQGATSAWMQYKFNSEVRIKQVMFQNSMSATVAQYSTHYVTDKSEVLVSKDGSTWKKIGEIEITDLTNLKKFYFDMDSNDSYQYVKLNCLHSTNNDFLAYIGALQFYGLDYSEHTERKWIYENGVECENATVNSAGSGKAEKKSDEIHLEHDGSTSTNYAEFSIAPIDLTPYTLLRMECGENAYSSAQSSKVLLQILKGSQTFPVGYGDISSTYISGKWCDGLPRNAFVDISSVNESSAICSLQKGSGGGSVKADFKKLWLE